MGMKVVLRDILAKVPTTPVRAGRVFWYRQYSHADHRGYGEYDNRGQGDHGGG